MNMLCRSLVLLAALVLAAGEGTCKTRKCMYSKGAKCQCDSKCSKFDNCCSDYEKDCAGPAPAPAPHPKPKPAPTPSPAPGPAPAPTPGPAPAPAPTPSPHSGGMTCLGEDNQPVDWWFAYKMPNGFSFAYKDAKDSSASKLSVSPGKFLNRTQDGSLGATLHQIYADKAGTGYVFYNDERPASSVNASAGFLRGSHNLTASGEGAHAKGVLGVDSSGSGFWLIHSVPKFPDLSAPTFRWTASHVFAQHFLCVSLDAKGVNEAALQLAVMGPDIFVSNFPSDMPASVSALGQLAKKEAQLLAAPAGQRQAAITSVGGQAFTHFSKSSAWGKDLYEDFVEPSLQMAFNWQTWRRMPYTMKTYCTPTYKYNSINVMSMAFDDQWSWDYSKDHCKWGVSVSGATVCVGDINRMTSQAHRGGGTMCFKTPALHGALSACVATTQKC